MSSMTVSLVDPSWSPSTAGSEGDLIDEMRDNCGFIIQGIDWLLRKVGFDLIGAILDPIAGDFNAVDAMASNWGVLGNGLGQIGHNYSAINGALPSVWAGRAADAASGKITGFADAFATQAEGAQLVMTAMQDMLTATKAVVELVADAMSMVDDLAVSLICSWFKLAKELATGGATIRKIVHLVEGAIEAIKTLHNVIPPLLLACAIMSSMMKALDMVFLIGNVAGNATSGSKADDVANAGF
jgi:hypothetical protein